jgi:cysteine desulfurase/selenocysteine lyase
MANEMFRALPGSSMPGQPGVTALGSPVVQSQAPAGSLPAAPVGLPASSHGPLPSVATLPTETDLRSTPALLAGASGAAATAGSPRSSWQATPAFPSEADLRSLVGLGVAGDPTAGFWTEPGRGSAPAPLSPAGSLPPTPVGLPASSHGPLPNAASLPTETDLRSTPALLAGATGAAATAGSPRSSWPETPGFPSDADLRSLIGLGVAGDPSAGFWTEPGRNSPAPGHSGLPTGSSSDVSIPLAPERGEEGVRGTPTWSPDVIPAGIAEPDFFDAASLKKDFPILSERVNGRPIVWLDNAATTQKPRAVIDRLSRFYEHENSNVHRAAHTLAARATDAYESARETVRRFLNAESAKQIVWVRGTTEGMNLLSNAWGRRWLSAGDEIILTHLEHHSNIVPWQLLCAATGAKLKIAPVDDSGQLLLDAYERLFTPRTKLVSATQVSNALGTILPVKEMIDVAHRYGAKIIIDGAQAVSHLRIDVQALDCDAFVFSGHKVFGPTGIGAVYGKQDFLDSMLPWQGGGNMIADVTFERTVYQPPPMRFEAGTGNIADAVGLGAALDYLMTVGVENVTRHEHELLEYGTRRLLEIPGLHLVGTATEKAGVLSFVMDGHRTEDIGKALDVEGIAVRSGHHCAQPALRRFGLESSVRASLALYNTCEDLDALVDALRHLQASY